MFELSHQAILWVQALGFVSMAIGWWANAQLSDQKLISGNLLASSITAVHLGLLGSTLGMMTQLLNIGRFATCRSEKARCGWRITLLPFVFSALAVTQGMIWAEHWSEWAAVTAAVLMSYALFYCSSTRLRYAMLLSNLLNLTLSIHLLSWSGIAYQLVTIAIILKGLPALKQQPYALERTT
ncbi:YgjV family protein [Shewanella sp. KX20019]|uniref:YgjV family protein n=1 Tax=Shewanella sp. KX20019 TaxID=2803864 RepID=UPI001925D48E|nr:YgjV family protein [Shewanella sp. KX20019]QQX79158.1 YgjV family protein [Shewanella sp. KX20019]